MRLHRISVQTMEGIGRDLTRYQARRINLLYAFVENLLFNTGFEKLRLDNCNFIYITLLSPEDGFGIGRYPRGRSDEYEWSMVATFDTKKFYELPPLEQLAYAYEQVLGGIEKNFEYYGLDCNIFNEARERVVALQYSNGHQKRFPSPNRRYSTIFRYTDFYDCYTFYLDLYFKKELVGTFEICHIRPIYIPAEHSDSLWDTTKNISYPEERKWIDSTHFMLKVGYKRYVLDAETKKVFAETLVEEVDTYVNPNDLYDGKDVV